MYPVSCTRVDGAHAASFLGQNVLQPEGRKWKEMQRTITYLQQRGEEGLLYEGGEEAMELIGYADASHASDKKDRKGAFGYEEEKGERSGPPEFSLAASLLPFSSLAFTYPLIRHSPATPLSPPLPAPPMLPLPCPPSTLLGPHPTLSSSPPLASTAPTAVTAHPTSRLSCSHHPHAPHALLPPFLPPPLPPSPPRPRHKFPPPPSPSTPTPPPPPSFDFSPATHSSNPLSSLISFLPSPSPTLPSPRTCLASTISRFKRHTRFCPISHQSSPTLLRSPAPAPPLILLRVPPSSPTRGPPLHPSLRSPSCFCRVLSPLSLYPALPHPFACPFSPLPPFNSRSCFPCHAFSCPSPQFRQTQATRARILTPPSPPCASPPRSASSVTPKAIIVEITRF
ncbi:unnamed protein product [Closterium sp. NIES-65]|nr:unnamed protein product [Closterium sp. NIES-65]